LGSKKKKKKAKKLKLKLAAQAAAGARAREDTARVSADAPRREPIPTADHGIRKQPTQKRSVDMVQAILQAAAQVFAELGYARATTNKIAERAGVSVGSLYQYFANKDSLLASLLAKHHADVHEVVGEALRELTDLSITLEQGLRRLLTDLVALHESDSALTKALSAAVLLESPVADEQHKLHDRDDEAQALIALLASRPDVRRGDHAAMAAVLAQNTAQLTRWLVHDAPPSLDRAALLDEVVRMLVGFLRSEG